MPLVGLVDEARRSALDLTPDEWSALKSRVRRGEASVKLPGCDQPGHLRTRKGTQFFAHNPSTKCDSHAPESADHLAAKAVVVRAAREAGWVAEPEVRGEDWIADVMCTRGAVRVAIEIQWTQQTEESYRVRQSRYSASGVRAAWFARHLPEELVADREVPAFELRRDEAGQFLVTLNPRPKWAIDPAEPDSSLAEAVNALLSGHVVHRDQATAAGLVDTPVVGHEYGCYRCGGISIVWDVGRSEFQSPCGGTFSTDDCSAMWDDESRIEARPGIRAAVEQAHRGSRVPLAKLGMRFTKTTGTTYMAFGCPHCDAVFGDFYLRQELMNLAYSDPALRATVRGPGQARAHPHWCRDQGQGHCEEPAAQQQNPQLPDPEAINAV